MFAGLIIDSGSQVLYLTRAASGLIIHTQENYPELHFILAYDSSPLFPP